jgi:hypothetical protein
MMTIPFVIMRPVWKQCSVSMSPSQEQRAIHDGRGKVAQLLPKVLGVFDN